MVHAADAAYSIRRINQSRTAALDATEISFRISHRRLCAAYEINSHEADAASSIGAKAAIDVIEDASILQMASRL